MEIRTFRPGDDAAQVSIYNEAAADLPKFKAATLDEVRRRSRAAEFDPSTRFVAVVIDIVALAILYGILNAIHLGGLDSLAGTIYFVYCWSTTGQTLGDMAMKIKVARTDGQPLSIGTGIVRYVGYAISIAVIFIGVLWVLWDPNKQGWHDKIANTVVVRTQ